jgi:hypothetical protein
MNDDVTSYITLHLVRTQNSLCAQSFPGYPIRGSCEGLKSVSASDSSESEGEDHRRFFLDGSSCSSMPSYMALKWRLHEMRLLRRQDSSFLVASFKIDFGFDSSR